MSKAIYEDAPGCPSAPYRCRAKQDGGLRYRESPLRATNYVSVRRLRGPHVKRYAGLSMVPGYRSGHPGCIRVSRAKDMTKFLDAIDQFCMGPINN